MTAVVEFGLDVDEWGAAGTAWLGAAQRHFKDGCGGKYPGSQFYIAMGGKRSLTSFPSRPSRRRRRARRRAPADDEPTGGPFKSPTCHCL